MENTQQPYCRRSDREAILEPDSDSKVQRQEWVAARNVNKRDCLKLGASGTMCKAQPRFLRSLILAGYMAESGLASDSSR